MGVDCGPAPTLFKDLAELATRHKADKFLNHSYLPVYEESLGPRRADEGSLLEIGVMNGGSVKMWLDWLPSWTVAGIDYWLPAEELLEGCDRKRLELHVCAADDGEKIAKLFRAGQFDVIIDDGSHQLRHQILSLHYLWEALKPGGLYFIEDVQDIGFADCFAMMPGYRVHDLREKSGRYDDVLIVMKKSD